MTASYLPLPSAVSWPLVRLFRALPAERARVAKQARAMYGPRWRHRVPSAERFGLFGTQAETRAMVARYREIEAVCQSNGWNVREVVAAAIGGAS